MSYVTSPGGDITRDVECGRQLSLSQRLKRLLSLVRFSWALTARAEVPTGTI
jgi:hypothetical protein